MEDEGLWTLSPAPVELSDDSLTTQKYPTPPLSPRRPMDTASGPAVDLTRGTGVFGDCDDDDDAIFATIPEPASSSGAAGQEGGLSQATSGRGLSQATAAHTSDDHLCACGVPCAIKTSNTAKDYGRQYWACSKEPGNGKCGFFRWEDDKVSPSRHVEPAEELSFRNFGGGAAQPTASTSGVFAEASVAQNLFADTGPEHPEWQAPGKAERVPLCWCKPPGPAMIRTSNSAKNPNRDFWTCFKSISEKCKFFQWADEPFRPGQQFEPQPGEGQQTPQRAKRDRDDGEDESEWAAPTSSQKRAQPEVSQLCHCNEPCIQRTSTTKANPNRAFYVCAKPRDAQDNCGFFMWVDDADERRKALGSPESRGYGGPPSAGFGGRPSGGYEGPAPSPGRGGLSSAGRSDACYKCGEVGHWASSCPKVTSPGSSGGRAGRGWGGREEPPRTGTGAGRGGAGRGRFSGGSNACYKCGGNGHWASVCPGI